MKVLIATQNKGKVEGAKRAFEKYFDDVEVIKDYCDNDRVVRGVLKDLL